MDRPITRRGCRHVGLLLAAALAPAWGGAQTSQRGVSVLPVPPTVQTQPPRDRPPAAPRIGTAAIKGTVVDGVTGNPIGRARVRLVSGPAGPKPPILTDALGAFEFTALPAGSYTLTVEKSTYLPGRYPELNRSMRARMQPLVLRDGQVVEDLSVSMFRGSAIAGRVLDAYGDPVDQAQVQVLRVPRGGRPTNVGQSQTNDLGEFRVPRLAPGRYIVQVRPRMNQYFQDPSVVEPPLPQPLPTYYPNAPSMAQAQVLTLNRGETISGVDMMLADGTPTVVTGVVVRADGEVVNAGSVNARVSGAEAAGGYDNSGGTGVRQGGSFRLTLAPGEYTLEAQVMTRQGPGPVGPDDQLVGTTRISVGGASTETVTIVVGRGATATGRVVFEGSTPPPPSPGQARVPLFNPEGPGCRSGQATIAADWSFKIEGLSGTCGAPPQSMFGRWTLKAVTFRGQNLLEHPVTFETGQQYTNVQVVVTDKRTQMDLRVSGDDGQATREYVALAFPTNKEKWNPQLRLVRTYVPPAVVTTGGRTGVVVPSGVVTGGGVGGGMVTGGVVMGTTSIAVGQSGLQERFVGLTPGEYYVIAVDDMDPEDSQDPGVLERLASSATRVTLTDEAPIDVPLRRFSLADLMR
jgi:hypothetical protein